MTTLLSAFAGLPFWRQALWLVNAGILLSALTVTFLVEESIVWLPFVLAVVGLLCLIGGLLFAIFLSAFLTLLFYVATFAKYSFSGFGLVAGDSNLIGRNLIDLLVLDWRVQVLSVVLFAALLLQAAFLKSLFRPALRPAALGVVFMVTALATVPTMRNTIAEVRTSDDRLQEGGWSIGLTPSLSTFVASIDAPLASPPTEPRAPWGDVLAGSAQVRQQAPEVKDRKVNLIVVLYESTFDPLYLEGSDFPVRDSELLRPQDGDSGPLLVPAYGGGTWLTEFALLTGQTPLAYGPNAYSLNSSLEGRIGNSLIGGLLEGGFGFQVIYPFPGYFIYAGSFYRGLGGRFVEPTDEEVSAFRRGFDNRHLFERALENLDPDQSNLQLVVTMLNHGPHRQQDPFEDYWERLKQQERKLEEFKGDLAEAHPGHETYILAFGDHQPLFTRGRGFSKGSMHTTFWSLDCVAVCAAPPAPRLPRQPLGVEFLLTLVLQELRLPTGLMASAQKELLARGCLSLQFACAPQDAHAFNYVFNQVVVREAQR